MPDRTATPIIGSNQAPGGKCTNPFHYTASDGFDGFDINLVHHAKDAICPGCGAVTMPGGAVWPEFAIEYKRRIAEGICLASRGGTFIDSSAASREALDGGACLCALHNR